MRAEGIKNKQNGDISRGNRTDAMVGKIREIYLLFRNGQIDD